MEKKNVIVKKIMTFFILENSIIGKKFHQTSNEKDTETILTENSCKNINANSSLTPLSIKSIL